MKKIGKLLSLVLLTGTIFSSCGKEEKPYVSKNLPIETVFDSESGEKENKSDESETINKSDGKSEDNKSDKKEKEEKTDNDNSDKESNKDIKADNSSADKGNEEKEAQNGSEIFTTKDVTNIRSTPEFSDNVVDTIPAGSKVKVLEKNIGDDKTRAKIEYQEKVYYMSMQVLGAM